MSISTAIANLLEANTDLENVPGGSENEAWYESALAKVRICKEMIDDEASLLVQKKLGELLEKIQEKMK
jgi:hypothetical protein